MHLFALFYNQDSLYSMAAAIIGSGSTRWHYLHLESEYMWMRKGKEAAEHEQTKTGSGNPECNQDHYEHWIYYTDLFIYWKSFANSRSVFVKFLLVVSKIRQDTCANFLSPTSDGASVVLYSARRMRPLLGARRTLLSELRLAFSVRWNFNLKLSPLLNPLYPWFHLKLLLVNMK